MSQDLSFAAVVIGTLRVQISIYKRCQKGVEFIFSLTFCNLDHI